MPRRVRPARRTIVLASVGLLVLVSGLGIPAGAHSATHGAPLGDRSGVAAAALAPREASPRSAVSAVDPFALISTEPAPMGIADFGVNGVGGVVQPYSYATPEFQANVQIDSLYMSGGGAHDMTFQLNTVLVLEDGSRNYSYWIQDVAEIDTTYNGIYWADNIWNLSGASQASSPLSPSELRGNGSVNDYYGVDWYAVAVASGLPGTGIDLAYPTNITVREVASTIDGLPEVAFMYDDGYGWATFDNVTFLHAAHWRSVGFVVDGYQYTPMGVFYDAEWDYSGNHQDQHNIDCDLNMTLEYLERPQPRVAALRLELRRGHGRERRQRRRRSRRHVERRARIAAHHRRREPGPPLQRRRRGRREPLHPHARERYLSSRTGPCIPTGAATRT